MLNQASNLAQGVDNAFIFIFAMALIFTLGITLFMIYTVIKYNRKKGKESMTFTGSVKLEIIWTVIPTIIVLIMFWYGWKGFAPMRTVPEGAMEIDAIGRMWEWEFDYGDGKISKELVIPIDKPVKLNLISEDVNHSLFIPAFRVKEDVVPGYDNWLWFTATQLGDYEVLCTEYCGLLHSAMITTAKVVPEADYNSWLTNLVATGNIPDHEGLTILKANGCIACHSLDGAKLVGPSFKGLWGSERVVVTDDGEKTVNALADYIKLSITDPNAEVVKGFNKGLMQSYTKTISEEDMGKIIDYFKQEGGKN